MVKNKKIKLFLGGYVNQTGAQNNNCRSILVNIDKNKFDIRAITVYSGNDTMPMLSSVEYYHISWPHKIFKFYAYMKGILWCDIAYLPKGEINNFNHFLLKIFKKNLSLLLKVFTVTLFTMTKKLKKLLEI